MEIKEYSDPKILEGGQVLLVGISIKNSYFKEKNLTNLLLWASNYAQKVYIMIPDEPAVHTLMAIGYTDEKAQRVARLQSNSLENKCLAIIEKHALQNCKIIRWDNFSDNSNYQKSLAQINLSYINDDFFREAIRTSTSEVLANTLQRLPLESEVDTGVPFLLKELSLICNATLILYEQKVAYVYHKTMQVLKGIFDEKYSFRAALETGFLTVE